MTNRLKLLPRSGTLLLPAAIGFRLYVAKMPTVRCVILNEKAQATVKESGDRCSKLTANEEAILFDLDGVRTIANQSD